MVDLVIYFTFYEVVEPAPRTAMECYAWIWSDASGGLERVQSFILIFNFNASLFARLNQCPIWRYAVRIYTQVTNFVK